jgi:hypothetical protein
MHHHDLEPPHPCRDCRDDAMRAERCREYVNPMAVR